MLRSSLAVMGDKSVGYFVEPTVIQTTDPMFKSMVEEIFGPVITIYVYDDNKYEETLELCDRTSPYALTGSIFARDRYAIDVAFNKLRYAAGNFYINDKPTGAVIAQQPFGGSRASGTNDKAGGPAEPDPLDESSLYQGGFGSAYFLRLSVLRRKITYQLAVDK